MFLNRKQILFIILGLLVLIGLVVASFFIIKKEKEKEKEVLTAEEQALQKTSEEMGKSKFDADGVIVSVAADGKTLICKVTAGSKTISDYVNKEAKLQVSESIQVLDKEGKEIKITDLKPENQVNIKGSIEDKNLVAELIIIIK